VSIGRDKLFYGDIRLAGVELLSGDPTSGESPALRVGHLEMERLGGAVRGATYTAESMTADGVETRPQAGRHEADEVLFHGVRVCVHTGSAEPVDVSIKQLGLSGGGQYKTGANGVEIIAPRVSLDDVRVVIPDVGALLRRERPAGGGPPDLHFLDVLHGHLHLDLVVDMTVPWIGRRRKTHYFRVPVEYGTIDYQRLEDDVHWLEGLFLTLDLVGDRLVLARDLPLLPMSKKALLEWPLAEKDLQAAAFHRVHLRNVFGWQVSDATRAAGDNGKSGKGKKLTLHSLAMENIDITLTATAPTIIELSRGGVMQLGSAGQPGLVDGRWSGAIRYDSTGAVSPTLVTGVVELLEVTLKDVLVGAAQVNMDRLHVGRIHRLALHFDGLRLHRAEVDIDRMTAGDIRVTIPAWL